MHRPVMPRALATLQHVYRPTPPPFVVVLPRERVEAALLAAREEYARTVGGGDDEPPTGTRLAYVAALAATGLREVLHSRGFGTDTTEVVVVHPEHPDTGPAWIADARAALPADAYSTDPQVDGIARAVVTLHARVFHRCVTMPFLLETRRTFRRTARGSGVMVGFPFEGDAPATAPDHGGFVREADFRDTLRVSHPAGDL